MVKKQALISAGAIVAVIAAALIFPESGKSENRESREKGHGVVEIDQAKVMAGGVTPGDEPGYPVTIDSAGSYRLSGNITVPDESTTAIEIAYDNVSLDLNGFTILGPASCDTKPFSVDCSPAGSGKGISYPGEAPENSRVFNGTVRGMGSSGIRLGPTSRIEKVHAIGNGGDGISTYSGSVSGCTAKQNGGRGITVTGDGMITDNISNQNGRYGIYLGGSGIVTGNAVIGTRADGIYIGNNTTVAGNTVINSQGAGIRFSWKSGNNGVTGNTIVDNYGIGLDFGPGKEKANSGYASNVINGNTVGTVAGNGIEMGTNVCHGETVCP